MIQRKFAQIFVDVVTEAPLGVNKLNVATLAESGVKRVSFDFENPFGKEDLTLELVFRKDYPQKENEEVEIIKLCDSTGRTLFVFETEDDDFGLFQSDIVGEGTHIANLFWLRFYEAANKAQKKKKK